MIICFEEKDRAAIESKGITIIEFKRDLYKFESNIRNAWENLKECADKVIKGFNIMAERFLEMVESVKLVFEEICEIYGYPTSYRYRIAKVFSKCTGTDIRFCWKFTWKIKKDGLQEVYVNTWGYKMGLGYDKGMIITIDVEKLKKQLVESHYKAIGLNYGA